MKYLLAIIVGIGAGFVIDFLFTEPDLPDFTDVL